MFWVIHPPNHTWYYRSSKGIYSKLHVRICVINVSIPALLEKPGFPSLPSYHFEQLFNIIFKWSWFDKKEACQRGNLSAVRPQPLYFSNRWKAVLKSLQNKYFLNKLHWRVCKMLQIRKIFRVFFFLIPVADTLRASTYSLFISLPGEVVKFHEAHHQELLKINNVLQLFKSLASLQNTINSFGVFKYWQWRCNV